MSKNTLKNVEDNIDAGMADSWKPPHPGEEIGGGSSNAAAMHREMAAKGEGVFDSRYDGDPNIEQTRRNYLAGRDNEDDGDGTDEDASWDGK